MTGRFRAEGDPDAGTTAASVATETPPVIIVDASQRCVEVNESASRMLGKSRAQIVGRDVESLNLPDGHLLVLPRIEDEADVPISWTRSKAPAGDDRPAVRRPSKREREILALLAGGSTDQQIAVVLGLSPATVQTHVRNAKAKLGARTRAQAVALALVSGQIELD